MKLPYFPVEDDLVGVRSEPYPAPEEFFEFRRLARASMHKVNGGRFIWRPVKVLQTRISVVIVTAILGSPTNAASAEEPLKLADSQLEPVNWTELAGWTADDHLAAFAAYQTSCQALRKIRHTDDHGPIYGALWNVCRKAIGLQPQDSDDRSHLLRTRIFNPCASRVWARPRGC